MSGLSAAGETAVLAPLTTTCFVSLHTADPGATGANEVSGGSYARQSAAFANAGANPTISSNSAIITFPTATANWGTITHFGLWTAASAGTYNGGNPVSASKAVNSGDQARFAAGALTLSAD